MFNLQNASQGIRKAAAILGIKSGKFESVFDPDNVVIAKVYNRNNPEGVEIYSGEAESALNYTWKEIRVRAI